MKNIAITFFGLIGLTYLYHWIMGVEMTENTSGGMIFFGVCGLIFVALSIFNYYNSKKEI